MSRGQHRAGRHGGQAANRHHMQRPDPPTLCARAAPTAARMHTIRVGVALVTNSAQAETVPAPAAAPASMGRRRRQ